MKRIIVRSVALAVIALGWMHAASAQMLNSERIELTFGSYGIDVLYSDAELRLSNLYSLEAGRKRMRTLAIVAYPATVDAAVASVHRQILEGESIGSTFRNAGWEVIKTNLIIGSWQAEPPLDAAMGIRPGASLAMHAYRFDVVRDHERLEYATIIELHDPAYLTAADLEEIYGGADAELLDARTGDQVGGLMQAGLARLAAVGSALRE